MRPGGTSNDEKHDADSRAIAKAVDLDAIVKQSTADENQEGTDLVG